MSTRSTYSNAIAQVIASAPGPLSADEIRDRLRDTGIGIATVYRVLKSGIEAGLFVGVDMPNAPTRYEPADRPHHHHFACDDCGRVYDIAGCPGGFAQLLPEGFLLSRHEVLLFGTCDLCDQDGGAP